MKTQRLRDAVAALMQACNELMEEFISHKRAADWGVINDAMVLGVKVLRDSKAD